MGDIDKFVNEIRVIGLLYDGQMISLTTAKQLINDAIKDFA